MARPTNLGAYRASFYPLLAQVATDPQTSLQLTLPYGKALEMRRRFYHMRGLLQNGISTECRVLSPFADQLHIQIKMADGKAPPKGYPASDPVVFSLTHDCIFDAALFNAMQESNLLPGLPSSKDPQLHIVETIRQLFTPAGLAQTQRPQEAPQGVTPAAIKAQAEEFYAHTQPPASKGGPATALNLGSDGVLNIFRTDRAGTAPKGEAK